MAIGSCRNAGFTECCTTGSCVGTPVGDVPCYCDFICVFFGDCCFDADATCHGKYTLICICIHVYKYVAGFSSVSSHGVILNTIILSSFSPAPTYDLLVGNGDHVSQVHFEGTTSVTVRTNTTGNVVGVDFYAELVNTIVHMKWLIIDVHCIFAANP